tara:strand:+ start:1052 stop:1810 length:759 start_codon:yes stop_codon:yes gene_type:complete
MAITVLSGTSGALYYKPAGTVGTFGTSNVTIGTETIVVQSYLNLKVGDPVQFKVINSQTGGSGTGTLPAGLSAGTTYYVIAYTASTGALQVSASLGGSAVNLTDVGTAASPNEFEVFYDDYAAVGQVQSWSFEVTRSEIDVTTIGGTVGQYAPFKTYISGFADGTGTASVYVTDEDTALSNRMVEDVLQRQQVGAAFKLYQDKQATEALSRSISMDAVLLGATFNINAEDSQIVEVSFRPTNTPNFDFSTSS